jgi:hypothetical protein
VSHSFLVLEPTGMRAVKLRWLPEMDEPKWSEQTFIDQWSDRPPKVYRADPSTPWTKKAVHQNVGLGESRSSMKRKSFGCSTTNNPNSKKHDRI